MFVRRGLDGATVREIVEEAGLTVPVLYYHFSGKEEIYSSVIAEGRTRFRALLDEALRNDGDVIERLRRIACVYVRFGRENPLRLRLLWSEIFRAPGHPELQPDAGELNAWTKAEIERVFEEARDAGALRLADPVVARRLFVGVLIGLLAEQAREPEAAVLDDGLAEHVVKVFCAGLAATCAADGGGIRPAVPRRPETTHFARRPRAQRKRRIS